MRQQSVLVSRKEWLHEDAIRAGKICPRCFMVIRKHLFCKLINQSIAFDGQILPCERKRNQCELDWGHPWNTVSHLFLIKMQSDLDTWFAKQKENVQRLPPSTFSEVRRQFRCHFVVVLVFILFPYKAWLRYIATLSVSLLLQLNMH